jgi:hypothetical protein
MRQLEDGYAGQIRTLEGQVRELRTENESLRR